MTAAVTLAPAKINLALHVTGQREDGYHLLDSIVVFTRLGDLLALSEADDDSFAVTGPHAIGLAGTEPQDNLVMRALAMFRAVFPDARAQRPFMASLTKNLPVASGIGGGSADAAAMLRLLARRCGIALTDPRLGELALSLGADVPMCLDRRPLRMRGIGERLENLSLPSLHMVLVNPGVGVSTPAVFNALTEKANGGLAPPDGGFADIVSLRSWLSENSRNDLQPAAARLCPVIETCLSALNGSGAAFARMSGSGATCFGLYRDAASAADAVAAISRVHPGWFVHATTSHASVDNDDATEHAELDETDGKD